MKRRPSLLVCFIIDNPLFSSLVALGVTALCYLIYISL